MSVYVDDEQIRWRGKAWCHLVADTLAELHEFAERLDLRREWFQSKSRYPHYDVTLSMRDKALRMGAMMGDRITIYECAVRLQHEAVAEKRVQVTEGPLA